MKLIKFNNTLLNLENFAGFEFEDESQCIWAYLPRQTDHKLDYIPLSLKNAEDYLSLKSYIESAVIQPPKQGSAPKKSNSPPAMKPSPMSSGPQKGPTKPRPVGVTHPPKPKSPFKINPILKKS